MSCKIDTSGITNSLTIADSLMALRIAADNTEPLQRVEAGSSTQRDTASLTASAVDSSRYKAGAILGASRQVDLLERNALLGSARLQYSFSFASTDSSHDTFKTDSRGRTSKQVTKREKRGLLNSGYNQYSLNLFD